ncbi:hypothetical protein TNCV_747881 [Trichonephila clavipes]|nr:hypothetical protein TNCV_747881 [Trichonephila clavipes]
MPSAVQSNCDVHHTIVNRQYGAVWSMGHTQQVCVRIFLILSNVWQQFFGRSAFLRQQETDLPPAELWLVVKIMNSWPAYHEFERSTIEDLPYNATMLVKSIESSNVLPLLDQRVSTNRIRKCLSDAQRQWSCPVEWSPTLQRLRGQKSDTLYRNVAPLSDLNKSADAKPWKEK